MGLMICPDCSKEVSTLALACPHCGRPIQAIPQQKAIIKNIHVNYIMLVACLCMVGMMIYIIYAGLGAYMLMIPGTALVGTGVIFLVYRLVAPK